MNARPRILSVDDEPFNLDYLEQELADLGYDSICASSGSEALEKTFRDSPDLILLDVMMPGMDGFQVLAQLKGDAATRDIPVVVVSALGDLQSAVNAIKAGAEDYLPKPINPILLQARLQNGLEKKRLRDQEQLYLRSLERELQIGREIQAGFLPKELPRIPGWDIAAFFRAARQVAGDFYDVFALPQINRIGLLIGDVCDKGVGAALFMTLFRSLLRAGVEMDRWTAAGPAEDRSVRLDDAARLTRSITLTNNYIAQMHGDTGMFATVFFALLQPNTGELAYVNAGQEEPIVLGPSGIRSRLSRTGLAVGIFPDSSWPVARLTLRVGETLILLTDGAADAQNENGEAWTREMLERILSNGRGQTSDALLRSVASQLDAHIGRASQFDDVTLMAVQRTE